MTTGQQRLFLALWPDPATRTQLAAVARQWTRHPVPEANLHLTLAFLGSCDLEKWRCVNAAASTVVVKPFELNIDCMGAWPRSRTRWLAPSGAPGALGELVQALDSALLRCDFRREQQRFVPHITLTRKLSNPGAQADFDAIRWSVDEFVLVESLAVEGGVRYVVRSRWPLSGTCAARHGERSEGA